MLHYTSKTKNRRAGRYVIKDISACSNSAFCLVLRTFVVASEYLQFVLDMNVPVYCHIELLLLLI